MSAPVFIASAGLRGLDEDLALLDAQAKSQGIDPASIRGGTSTTIRTQPAYGADAKGGGMESLLGGGALDFVKNIFNQGGTAATGFQNSVATIAAQEAARERSRTLKMVGGGLFALGALGFAVWGVSKLGKR